MRKLLWVLALGFALLLAAGLWMPAKAQLAQVLLARAWAQSQESQAPIRPWPWADTWPVAQLALPEQDQSLIVLAGDSGESLAFGPGHLSASAAPGEPGPIVLAGHRDTHFRHLKTLRKGSPLRLQDRQGSWQDYRVTGLRVVDSEKKQLDLSHFEDDQLILITCYPFDSLEAGGPLRYVVEANRLR